MSLGLARIFPADAGAAAETLVWARIGSDGRSLDVETIHSYPNERSVVFSRSAIALATARVAGQGA